MQQIWCKDLIGQKNITLAFTRNFKSEKPLELKLAASNEYQVFCNGKFLAYGPMRSAHGYSHTRRYPLCPDREGNVRLAVFVSGSAVNSYDRVDEQPFFAAEVFSEKTKVAESADFQAYRMTDRLQKVQRYSFQRTFTESYRMAGERTALLKGDPSAFPRVSVGEVKANQIIPENDLSEPDLHFIEGELFEHGACRFDPKRKVVRDRALTGETCVPAYFLFKESELEEVLSAEAGRIVCRPEAGEADTHLRAGSYLAYDLKRNSSGFFRFEASVRKSCVLYVLFDEIVTEKEGEGAFIDINRLQCCNAVKYALVEGEYSLLTFAPYTARYVRAVLTEGEAKIGGFGMVTYENPDEKLDFSCEDAELMSVIDAARATFRQNAVDVLTDCPSRERAGWLCDSYFTARAEKFLTGKNLVETNFLRAYLLAPELPFAKGMLPMCYPADHVDGVYIPNWAMWFIVELKDHLDRGGDRALIDACREKVYGILHFFRRYENEYGLLENLENWVFLEWSKANDFIKGVNFPSNMMYALALQCAAQLYDDKALSDQALSLKKCIAELSFNGTFFVDQALRDKENQLRLTENISETCQYYAFWTGVADRQSHPDLYRTLLTHFSDRDPAREFPDVHPSNAFIGRLIRMDYFLREGEYETVLKEAKTYYLPMARQTGTLWENLTTVASCNHGFSGYIAYLLVTAYNALHSA